MLETLSHGTLTIWNVYNKLTQSVITSCPSCLVRAELWRSCPAVHTRPAHPIPCRLWVCPPGFEGLEYSGAGTWPDSAHWPQGQTLTLKFSVNYFIWGPRDWNKAQCHKQFLFLAQSMTQALKLLIPHLMLLLHKYRVRKGPLCTQEHTGTPGFTTNNSWECLFLQGEGWDQTDHLNSPLPWLHPRVHTQMLRAPTAVKYLLISKPFLI